MERSDALRAVAGSDRCYFALAAEQRVLPGAVLLHLPDAPGFAAGTVIWVDDPEAVADRSWVEGARRAVRCCGAPVLRVYGIDDHAGAAAALGAAGLSVREELAYCGATDLAVPDRSPLELRPVSSPADREARRVVYRGSDRAPDGYGIDVEQHLRSEERRADAGPLELLVGWVGDVPVAAVGLLRLGPLTRVKNVMVRADHRRRGHATALTRALLRGAERDGALLGCLVVAGEPGEHVYRGAGMEAVGHITEWSEVLR